MANRFLNNITINDQYTLPSTDGDADQIIQTDGAGNLSFVDLSSIEGAASNFVYFEVKNETGSTINKGKGVMAVGTDGNSGHILIDEMVADGSIESKYFLGVLETTVANGGFARVISFGQLDQFNTLGQNGETWNDGDILWCDPNSAGDFTITEPDGPNVKIAAAIVLNAATNGKIQIRVQANEGIHDLHDTKITSQVDGDVLVWDDTTGVWFNDSTLNVDYTNNRVGVGTTSPAATLDVSGGDIRLDFNERLQWDNGNTNIRGNSDTRMYLKAPLGYYFETNGGYRVTINGSNGNVGIGTTSPTSQLGSTRVLDISSTGNGEIILDHTDAGASSDIGLYSWNRNNDHLAHIKASCDGAIDSAFISFHAQPTGGSFFNAASNERMRITSTGDVGIGQTNPAYKLDVNGTGRFTGDLRCLSLIQTSQRDQKENINDIDKRKATSIPFKEYTYKSSIDGLSRKRYGVIAEDIENDYPELVHTGPDGIKGVNYIDLLVKRVAELEKELEEVSLTPGPQGPQGATGPQGPAGNDGKNGSDGSNATIPILNCKGEEYGVLGSIQVCEGNITFSVMDPKDGKQIDSFTAIMK